MKEYIAGQKITITVLKDCPAEVVRDTLLKIALHIDHELKNRQKNAVGEKGKD